MSSAFSEQVGKVHRHSWYASMLDLQRAIHARRGSQARRDNVLPKAAEFGVHRPRRLERIHGAQEA
jgi:hypothetical protein